MRNEPSTSELKRLTVAAAIDHYLCKSDAPEWRKRGAALIKASPLGRIRVAKLSTSDLQKWSDRRLDQVCVATVQNDLRIVRLSYEAVRRTYGLSLPANPALEVELAEKDRKLTRGELAALRAALEKAPIMKALVTVAAETGLPRGALTSAQWRDVELDRSVIHIRQRSTGPIVRSVPLSDAAVEAMRSLAKTSPRVFPLSVANIRLLWERACRRTKLRHVRFFEARHVLDYEGRRSLVNSHHAAKSEGCVRSLPPSP